MTHLRKSNTSQKHRAHINKFTKPFKTTVPALVSTNDKRYISCGRDEEDETCNHEYCLAERRRIYGMEEGLEPQKPIGLPWASGLLKYLPGHLKFVFPLRKKPQLTSRIPYRRLKPDKITNPVICGILEEMIKSYKIFMLTGMILSEAKAEAEKDLENSDDLTPS